MEHRSELQTILDTITKQRDALLVECNILKCKLEEIDKRTCTNCKHFVCDSCCNDKRNEDVGGCGKFWEKKDWRYYLI